MTQHFRQFEITNISADNLKDVRLFGRMKVYAIVCVTGDPFLDPNLGFTTPTDYEGGVNPRWNNVHMSFTIHEPSLQTNTLNLNFRLYAERTFGDYDAGEFTVSIKDLFNMISGKPEVPPHVVNCPVYDSSKCVQGTVKFTFSFGRQFARAAVLPRQQQFARAAVLPRRQQGRSDGGHVGLEIEINLSSGSQDFDGQGNSGGGGDYRDDQADTPDHEEEEDDEEDEEEEEEEEEDEEEEEEDEEEDEEEEEEDEDEEEPFARAAVLPWRQQGSSDGGQDYGSQDYDGQGNSGGGGDYRDDQANTPDYEDEEKEEEEEEDSWF